MSLELLQAQPSAMEGEHHPVLLFVHGARHAAWCWEEHFLPYFARAGYPAFALSFRGHGGSPGAEALSTYTLDTYEEDVRQTIERLPEPPVLIAHSLGGAVVQRLLLRPGPRVRAVVLMASVPPDGVRWWDRLRTALTRRRDKAQLVRYFQSGGQSPFPDQIFFSATLAEAERQRFAGLIQAESPRLQPEIQQPVVPAGWRPDLPVLVLGAGNDWFLARGAIHRTARFYGTRAIIFDGMAHDMMLEPGWQEVAETIIGFVRGLS